MCRGRTHGRSTVGSTVEVIGPLRSSRGTYVSVAGVQSNFARTVAPPRPLWAPMPAVSGVIDPGSLPGQRAKFALHALLQTLVAPDCLRGVAWLTYQVDVHRRGSMSARANQAGSDDSTPSASGVWRSNRATRTRSSGSCDIVAPPAPQMPTAGGWDEQRAVCLNGDDGGWPAISGHRRSGLGHPVAGAVGVDDARAVRELWGWRAAGHHRAQRVPSPGRIQFAERGLPVDGPVQSPSVARTCPVEIVNHTSRCSTAIARQGEQP